MTEYDFGILRHVNDSVSGTGHDSPAYQPAGGRTGERYDVAYPGTRSYQQVGESDEPKGRTHRQRKAGR